MEYKVTIGIPFFNAEECLLDAIKSVFAQTISQWELILVDDGSSDLSLEIAKSIDDPRVKVFSDGRNKGLAARLNDIAEWANAPYVARMDADDLMAPERIERQLEVLEKHRRFDLVSTGLCSVNDRDEPKSIRVYREKPLRTKDFLNGGSGIVHASVVARKSWLIRNKYDTSMNLVEDYELWLRAFINRDLSYYLIDQPYYYYRENGSVVHRKMVTAYKNQIKVQGYYRKNVIKKRDKFSVFVHYRVRLLVARLFFYFEVGFLLKEMRMLRNKKPYNYNYEKIEMDIRNIKNVDVPTLRVGGVSGD